jgi:hypothetical protein
MLTTPYYENVVCDLHFADMRFVQVEHKEGRIEGFGKCAVGGCTRFFGVKGYCDLNKDIGFARVRMESTCLKNHPPQPMYLQRAPDCLLWVCPVCHCVARHRQAA